MSVIFWAAARLGHLLHEVLIGFVSFGTAAALFASVIGVAIWIVLSVTR
jgi:hypothetical protein